ncbi:MAG: cytochrome C [Candidatus Binataceae bacterium]
MHEYARTIADGIDKGLIMASHEGNSPGNASAPMMMAAAGGAGAPVRGPAGGAAAPPGGKRIEVPIKKAGGGVEEKLHTWPFLVRSEFLMTLLIIVVLTIWSLTINAPLEEPSNPTRTPNPSKAPWYFLGLQEMLVFFDPWYAGVVLPSFIIVGLMLIPYLDINPKGNGYYTFRERMFEILTFFLGFHVLWVSFIIIGTFFRGPGWNWFWPGQVWDPHLVEALTNVDLPYLFGFRDYLASAIFGLTLIIGYFVAGYIVFYLWIRARPANDPWSAFPGGGRELLEKWGPVRFGITGFLLIAMMGVFIKMMLRHALNIKYILVTPWINI